MQKSSFFNAELVDGRYDRTYNADDWATYFSSFLGTGIFAEPDTNLQVTAGSGMEVIVDVGEAFINGYYYKNTEAIIINLNPANGTYSRITNIVVELNLNDREIILKTIDGQVSNNPIAPDLFQTESCFQLCLAQITVQAGAVSVVSENITDTRTNINLCGYVKLKPNSDILNELMQRIGEINTNMINLEEGLQNLNIPSLGLSNTTGATVDINWINNKLNIEGFLNNQTSTLLNFDINNNTVTFDANILASGGLTLPSNQLESTTNFNNVSTPGIYYNFNYSTQQNCPSQATGVLVINSIETAQNNTSFPMVWQNYYDDIGNYFYRVNSGYGMSAWSNWYQVQSVQQQPQSEIAIGKTVCMLALQNAHLSYENKALGKQVCKLTIDNSTTQQKVKALANVVIENELRR